MEKILLILGSVLIIIVFVYISYYNKLTRARNSVLEAESGIDISLLKRFDLITDLVEVVKAYSKYETDLLVNIVEIRNEIKTNPDHANEQINSIVEKLNVTIESYPDLKASEQYLNLQKNMANVEEHLQASRRFYNNNVTIFNNMVDQFPSSLIAGMHKFTRMSLFTTDIENLVKPNVQY